MDTSTNHNKLGFATPQDYFKKLDIDIINQAIIDNGVNKSTGFDVPDQYFNQLSEQLINNQPSATITPINQIKLMVYPILAIAAIFALLLYLDNNQPSNTIASLPTDSIEDYIIDQTTIYDDDIVQLLLTDDQSIDQIQVYNNIQMDELSNYVQQEIEWNNDL